jgi:arylsulfatase
VDIRPTLVDLAGEKPKAPTSPALAGRSLTPTFSRDGAVSREFLYFNHNHNRAIRTGDWKLIATGDDGPWELYDLGKDRSEQNNTAAMNPDLTARFAAKWKAVDDEFTRTREDAPASAKQLMRHG